MATLGTPASARPIRARMTSSAGQPGRKADSRVRAGAANMEAIITGRRPMRSDSTPAGRKARAMAPVVSETARLEAAAPTPKPWTNCGSSGWTS